MQAHAETEEGGRLSTEGEGERDRRGPGDEPGGNEGAVHPDDRTGGARGRCLLCLEPLDQTGSSDGIPIRRILAALGLGPPEQDRAPPVREVVRVPMEEEGREIGAG